MKLQVLQQNLLPVVQAVTRSIGIKSTLPVLGNILLATQDGKLKLAATNLEIGVIKFVPAKITEEGEITVPAKVVLDILSSLDQTTLILETKADLLDISTGKFSAQINGIPASEFPIIPVLSDKATSFNKKVIKDYARIMFAASGDDGRPVLTGILTSVHQGKLDLVATDGFRLAHRQLKLKDQKTDFKTLIPKRTLEEVLRIIDEEPGADTEDDQISISTSPNQNQIVFTIGLTTVSSRLIEGQFPSWEKIIPEDHKTRVVVDRSGLVQATKLAAIFARNEANVLTLDIVKDKLTVTSETKELGSQTNEVECQTEGEPLKIAFSAKFLQDALSAADTESLMIEFSSPLSPALIKPVGLEGLEYIVMPVRQN